jgi:hypothetical protein
MADKNKSVVDSITGTFKSELTDNVLNKLGPSLGTAIEKALEARTDGKKFSDTFNSEYKSRLSESLKDRIFGQGIVGKSLRAGFEAKFGSKEEDPVEEIADSVNIEQGVLVRIETLATNISDNVYNITAAWSKNAKTLEETRKLQEEQHKQEMMSAEEAALESRSLIEPLSKPTPTGKENEKSGSGASGLTSMLSGLFKSAGKLKSALTGILKSKKFLALAAVTVGVGAVAAAIAGQDSSGADTSGSGESNAQRITPTITQQDIEENNSETQKLARLSKSREQNSEASTPVSKPSVSSAPPSTAGATSQSSGNSNSSVPSSTAGATSQSSGNSDVQRYKDYFERPENAAEGARLTNLSQKEQTIQEAIKQTKSLASKVDSPAEKAKYDLIIKNQLEPSLQVVQNQKQEILSKAESATSPQQGAATGSSAPAPSPVQAQPATAVSASPVGSSSGESGSSGEGGATMINSTPSSGANIAASSEAVETSATSPKEPKVINVDNSSSSTSSHADKPRKVIMSPVANRGSLDKMSFFNA